MKLEIPQRLCMLSVAAVPGLRNSFTIQGIWDEIGEGNEYIMVDAQRNAGAPNYGADYTVQVDDLCSSQGLGILHTDEWTRALVVGI
jgi:hypothetical protein